MPFTPEAKSPGDLIKSADWNEAMTEIVRLETDKVNKAGDVMTGDLTVASSLTVSGSPAPAINSSVLFNTDDNSNPPARIGTVGNSGNGTPGDLIFTTNGGNATHEKLRLTTTGRLGIGTTIPQSLLHVAGDITTSWGLTINHYNAGFGANQTRPWLKKAWNGTLGDYLTIGSTGNRTNEEQSTLILSENGVLLGRGHDDGDQLSVEWLRVSNTGNVGIGINDPQQKLDVNGWIQTTQRMAFRTSTGDDSDTNLFKGPYSNFIVINPGGGPTTKYFNIAMDHNPGSDPYSFRVGHTWSGTFPTFGWGFDPKFRVDSSGKVYADDNFNSGGADYADMFESHNGKKIPSGTAVVITDDGKIRKAKKSETPIGIVTEKPAILGNNPMEWHGKYLRDEYGNRIMEKFEDEVPVSEEAKAILEAMPKSKLKTKKAREGLTKIVKGSRPKLNPDYDPERAYIPRSDRSEWQAVGLIGQLALTKGQAVAPTWIKIKDVSDKVELWLVK